MSTSLTADVIIFSPASHQPCGLALNTWAGGFHHSVSVRLKEFHLRASSRNDKGRIVSGESYGWDIVATDKSLTIWCLPAVGFHFVHCYLKPFRQTAVQFWEPSGFLFCQRNRHCVLIFIGTCFLAHRYSTIATLLVLSQTIGTLIMLTILTKNIYCHTFLQLSWCRKQAHLFSNDLSAAHHLSIIWLSYLKSKKTQHLSVILKRTLQQVC